MSNRPPDISSRPLSAAANSPPNSKPVKRPCSFFQNAANALPQKPPTQTDTVASGHAYCTLLEMVRAAADQGRQRKACISYQL